MAAHLSEEEKNGLARRIRWLLFLRVLILSFFLGAAGLVYFLGGEMGGGAPFRTLQVPLIAAYVVSLISVLALRWINNLHLFAHLQVDFDILLVTGIIFFTGDIESPFPFLYNLAVLNGAILLFYRGAFFAAVFSSLCYGALLAATHYLNAPTFLALPRSLLMPLLLNIPTFFIIGFLGGYLARKLHEAEQLLKEKQKAYLDLEALKEALVEGIDSGVAITDLKGKISYFNNKTQSLVGSGNEIPGKRLTEIFPDLPFRFEALPEQKKVTLNDFSYVDPQGRDKHLRLTLAQLSDATEHPMGYLAVIEDVTKQKELEEKIRFEEEMRKARARDLARARGDGGQSGFHFEGVVGHGAGIEKIYSLVQKVAITDTNVLIAGESGTGKELVARAIHFNGPRRDHAFVAVNCGAIPENLMESELFGHVRGAFTGAVSDRDGLFKQADEGSIFLDEVVELPLHLQVKLLRVLQEKSFTPVGGSKQIKVNVRVISASNKDLRKEMEKGRFREDLFYRLNVVQLSLPPLRNRKEDIPLLTQHFVEKYAKAHSKQVEEISSDALMYLVNHSYPGNIRELENIIEHAVAVTNKNILTEEDLPPHIKGVPIAEEVKLFEKTAPGGGDAFFNKGISLDEELATHEKCLLIGALKRSSGVQKKAAEVLGINYRSFRHRLEKYGLLSVKNYGIVEEESVE